jgi:hypothetical protein
MTPANLRGGPELGGDHAARLDTLARLIELVREVSSESGADAR